MRHGVMLFAKELSKEWKQPLAGNRRGPFYFGSKAGGMWKQSLTTQLKDFQDSCCNATIPAPSQPTLADGFIAQGRTFLWWIWNKKNASAPFWLWGETAAGNIVRRFSLPRTSNSSSALLYWVTPAHFATQAAWLLGTASEYLPSGSGIVSQDHSVLVHIVSWQGELPQAPLNTP